MIDNTHSALLVVDIQRDFLPGGALGVADGDAIIEPIAALMERGSFARTIATQDWHPKGHISFASSHPGRQAFETIDLYGREQVLWPDHCVQDSPGAALFPDLPWRRVDTILRKGTDPLVDSYSAFRSNWNAEGIRPSTGLSGLLESCGLSDVYICGLARDYCVKWSSEDAVDLGFEVFVIWDLCRSIDAPADDALRGELAGRRIHIIDSQSIA